MAQIKIDLAETIRNGMDIKFQAPCDCSAITGLMVCYPVEDGTIESKEFSFRDAHGNDLAGLGNLFSRDSYVKVIVDTNGGYAYIQNADTNAYLESRFAEMPPVLVWENASSGSTFAAQTINVDLADFVAVDIEFRTTTQSGSRVVRRVYMGKQGILGEVINVTANGVYASAVMRTAKVSETGVQFAAGYDKLVANTEAREDNTRVVPTRIYGIRGAN